MIAIRRADERGKAEFGWLSARHSFSFGNYHDPAHMGFRSLRVINEDRVAPGMGFDSHGHRDMEIITYIIEGALEHKDSLGSGAVIRPGEVQRMTAGTGIVHSEFNPSATEETHLLQIWILPERKGLRPGYEQRDYPAVERRGRLRLVAARDSREGAVAIHQDAEVYASLLGAGEKVRHAIRPGRHAWLQVAAGDVTVNGHALAAGDGAAFSGEPAVEIGAVKPAEFLLFDLA
jgi:redox-sensitive bicupin YhaK (pirin superfamily)